jgi:polyhydroxybutyrate depolymerase
MKNCYLCLALALLLFGCDKNNNPSPNINYGKNRFTIPIDGVEREYYVHVPSGYDGNSKVPVVFMLHGTSGDGDKFYTNSGWKEVGETENILTVFPSSGRHCIIDDGVVKNTTKWNSQPAEWTYCPNETPLDDLKFLRSVIDALAQKYSIDQKRVYLVGFSNGGQMAAKCAIYLSDKLAAVVENAGSFSTDTTYTPLRRIPTAMQLGNKDYGPGVDGEEIPLSLIDTVLVRLDRLPFRARQTHVKSFNLHDTYTLSGDTSTARVATFAAADGNPKVYYNFVFVKGLGHVYPNGTNHWMKGAEVHWNWLKQFSIP